MVAYLKKTEGNAEFHQIVDLLTSSSIYHALTVSPTIYASNIEQFWNTANSQTINDEKQIHATVYCKTIAITKSSVRSDLLFTDDNGITCLTNAQIFENLPLMEYEGTSIVERMNLFENLTINNSMYLLYRIDCFGTYSIPKLFNIRSIDSGTYSESIGLNLKGYLINDGYADLVQHAGD
nr:hypothetical protein [Tanacetum cinerariifolium]